MGTPFDPSVHSIITGADGNPVPQYYDPEANGGDGGFVVQQSGSNVAFSEGEGGIGELIEPGQTWLSPWYNTSNYDKVRLNFSEKTASGKLNPEVEFYWSQTEENTSGDERIGRKFVTTENDNFGGSHRLHAVEEINNRGNWLQIRITNASSTEGVRLSSYRVVLL